VGGYQFSWNLGTPLLKRFVFYVFFSRFLLVFFWAYWGLFHPFSTLATFYYGNLSYPSQDPPKLGFLSTVPSDASGMMQSTASVAAKANNNFPGIFFPFICDMLAVLDLSFFIVLYSYIGAGSDGKFRTGWSYSRLHNRLQQLVWREIASGPDSLANLLALGRCPNLQQGSRGAAPGSSSKFAQISRKIACKIAQIS
jgi:hypothetical protein